MANVLVKTEAGQREIRERAVELPRSARTLLVLADGTRDREQLLTMVRGSSVKDVETLVQAGLIAEGAGTAAATRSASHDKPAPATERSEEPASALGFKEMYECLTELIREQLGVMKAFKYTLEVEKASTVDDLQVLAKRFIDDVQKQKGDSAANMVRRALGMR
jgi:hypothetical protein